MGRRTIQYRLQIDTGLRVYRPAKKPRLSEKNKKDRLAFARAHASWIVDDWVKCLFSDELTVRQFAGGLHTKY